MTSNINLKKLSERLFFSGIFLLASTLSIGVFLILVASIISLFCRKENPFKDNWTIFLIPTSIVMLISCLYQTFSQINKELIEWNISLTWIGLLNWIPFFYLFISTKDFLKIYASCRIRTCGPLLRRQLLYPAELRKHFFIISECKVLNNQSIPYCEIF